MNDNLIVFQFDDKKDADEVLADLCKYVEITWKGELKKAMIKVDTDFRKVLVSKSVNDSFPKPLKL